jgi:hypothetical protein
MLLKNILRIFKVNNNIGIYIVYHKEDVLFSNQVFKPISVGKFSNISSDKFLKDNTGDNISFKNDLYNELTALYWIWKNTKDEYVGLNHYRRFFYTGFDLSFNFKLLQKSISSIYKKYVRFEPYIKTNSIKNVQKELQRQQKILLSLLDKNTIIVPNYQYLKEPVIVNYEKYHRLEDFLITDQVLRKLSNGFYLSWNKIKNDNALIAYNMFIMHRENFNDYLSFLFEVLFEVEKQIKIPTDPYQKRVMGFLSERIFTAYIHYLKEIKMKKIIHFPILLFQNKE